MGLMWKILFACFVTFLPVAVVSAADTLDIYAIDTEGGKCVLIQTPDGESMLVDAGFPTADDRDTKRIVAQAEALGIKQFDYVLVTHYDGDHVGNIPKVDAKIPAKVFIDHGELRPEAMGFDGAGYKAYLACIGDRKRIIVKPGDTLPLKGVQVTVVTAAGEAITKPLPGAGQPNEFAKDAKPEPMDAWDNAGSVGLHYQFGKFRMLDLADLLQCIEFKLMVPNNMVGTVDFFMVSHHGAKLSNAEFLVHAIRPKAAVMNNGTRKTGDAVVFDIYRSSPGFQDLWQLHSSAAARVQGQPDKNQPEDFIANPTDPCQGKAIKISAQRDGTFTVTNTRNGFSKTYKP